jgi:hypothetical protein
MGLLTQGPVLFCVMLCCAVLCHAMLCSIYELYSDFVMKNPFYEVEQVCHRGCGV